jgi:two-component system chemotaxis response regulator CheY
MIRKLLLVDDSICMRQFLRQKIMANLNDIEVWEAKDTDEADQILAQKTCHLIIQSWHNSINDTLPFLKKLRENQHLRHVPFLLLSFDREEEQIRPLLEAGATECLYLPTPARVLAETINRVCNPVTLRKSDRYSFSSADAFLEQKKHCFGGQVINISLGGMLCELDWFDEFQCGAPLMARVEIPLGEKTISIRELYAKTVNLRLIESNPDHSARRIRIALAFLQVPEDSSAKLLKAFSLSELEESEWTRDH